MCYRNIGGIIITLERSLVKFLSALIFATGLTKYCKGVSLLGVSIVTKGNEFFPACYRRRGKLHNSQGRQMSMNSSWDNVTMAFC